jgi:hypothetical protein
MATDKTKSVKQSSVVPRQESLFVKNIELRRSDGSLKEIDQVSLKPWTMDNGSHGFSISLNVTKVGYARKFISIDPANDELRQAIMECYRQFDEKTMN